MRTFNRPTMLFMTTLCSIVSLPLFMEVVLANEQADPSPLPSPSSQLEAPIRESINQLSNSLPQANMSDMVYLNFIIVSLITLGLGLGFYWVIFGLFRGVLRRFESDLPLVMLGTSRIPATLLILTLGINVALQTLPPEIANSLWIQGLEKLLLAFGVMTAIHWISQVFVKVVAYSLRQYADQSEAMWDDVLVPLLESTVPIILYGIGIFLSLQIIGLDLTGLWVALGGAAFVLGFAVKDILSNFFSGLVLLIDTPFRFGDVILDDGKRAVIRKIGLRTTQLYLIDTHCEVYVPNSTLQSTSIVNLSRPTSHYYYTISIALPSDVDPSRASKLMEDVVLAHPDTLGDIDSKLQVLDRYFGFSDNRETIKAKREVGRKRLIWEKKVNEQLSEVEQFANLLIKKIKGFEQGGLDKGEVQDIRDGFLRICELVGLASQLAPQGVRGSASVLVEAAPPLAQGKLIDTIRCWYGAWLEDPDLEREDRKLLPRVWEQKISLLIKKLNRLYALILKPEGQETRLDDYVKEVEFWLRDSFKSSRNEWQDPKVWSIDDYTVKFYIDDITLEHCERGNRIQSEVRRELIWHLRQSYLLR